MGSEVANRPNRIGAEGVTMQWSFRVPERVTLAGREQARHDGTTLSEIMRMAMRAYMEGRGWDVDLLINGDDEATDAQWVDRIGHKAPRSRSPRKPKQRQVIDPGDTLELF